MLKILKTEDLEELKSMGYEINLFHDGKFHNPFKNPNWINPHLFWNCRVFDVSKKVEARVYKYVSNRDGSNVKLIRY